MKYHLRGHPTEIDVIPVPLVFLVTRSLKPTLNSYALFTTGISPLIIVFLRSIMQSVTKRYLFPAGIRRRFDVEIWLKVG